MSSPVNKKRKIETAVVSSAKALNKYIQNIEEVAANAVEKLPSHIEEIEKVRSSMSKSILQFEKELKDKYYKQKLYSCPVELKSMDEQMTDLIEQTQSRLLSFHRWLQCRLPREEDGNNFGVEVQASFVQRLSEYQKWCDDMLEENRNFYYNRVDAIKRLDSAVEITRKSNTNDKTKTHLNGDNTPMEVAVKSIESKPYEEDGLRYLFRLDALYYSSLRDQVDELITMYLFIYHYLINNYERILYPRGRDGGRNATMSMY